MNTSGWSFSSLTSMTMKRWCTSTWLAARPMPGASYMVSNMSSSRVWNAGVVDFGGIDRRGLGAQARIGEFEDRQQGHGVEMGASVTTASGRGILAPPGLPWAAVCGL